MTFLGLSYSNSYSEIMFFIFANMLFGGNTLPLSSIYITEMMTEDERIKYMSIIYVFWPFGSLLSLLFCRFKYETLENADWRRLFQFCAFFAFIASNFAIFFLVESPRYYFMKKNYE